MSFQAQKEKISKGQGFVAALDQSGGSTPKALKQYGIDETAYANEEQMFALVHEMRERIITAPAFASGKVIGAILFEKTMDADIKSVPTAQYLWEKLKIVPFLKIDKGLADEADGVQLMKPIGGLEDLLKRAKAKGIFGTKMRSVVNKASESGIAAAVKQQFDVARIILAHGLVPIIEPEVNIKAPDKAACEDMLKAEILKNLDNLAPDQQIMLKLSLPEKAGLYTALAAHEKVLQVVALSGGYSLDESCRRLAENDGMIASFSRALTNDLKAGQSDGEFNTTLQAVIDKIHAASVKGARKTQAA